jgi:hypothetical protein
MKIFLRSPVPLARPAPATRTEPQALFAGKATTSWRTGRQAGQCAAGTKAHLALRAYGRRAAFNTSIIAQSFLKRN